MHMNPSVQIRHGKREKSIKICHLFLHFHLHHFRGCFHKLNALRRFQFSFIKFGLTFICDHAMHHWLVLGLTNLMMRFEWKNYSISCMDRFGNWTLQFGNVWKEYVKTRNINHIFWEKESVFWNWKCYILNEHVGFEFSAIDRQSRHHHWLCFSSNERMNELNH